MKLRKLIRRTAIVVLVLLSLLAGVAWIASEFGQITITFRGFNPSGTTTVWISGGTMSYNWFTGGGGVPGMKFEWFVRENGTGFLAGKKRWVVEDFGPVPDKLAHIDQGVFLKTGLRLQMIKRNDAWRWPYLDIEVDEDRTPQLRKTDLWLVIVLLMAWPTMVFYKHVLLKRDQSNRDERLVSPTEQDVP